MSAKKRSGRKVATSREDRWADKVYEDFLKQPAQLTNTQMAQLEECTSSVTSGGAVSRRAAFASLTRSGAQLVEGIEKLEAARAVADCILAIDDYVGSLKALESMMVSASTRLNLALCTREDMQDLLKQAQAARTLRQASNPQGMLS